MTLHWRLTHKHSICNSGSSLLQALDLFQVWMQQVTNQLSTLLSKQRLETITKQNFPWCFQLTTADRAPYLFFKYRLLGYRTTLSRVRPKARMWRLKSSGLVGQKVNCFLQVNHVMISILTWVSSSLQVNHEMFPILIKSRARTKPAVEAPEGEALRGRGKLSVRRCFKKITVRNFDNYWHRLHWQQCTRAVLYLSVLYVALWH